MNIRIFYRVLYKTILLVFCIQSLLLSQGIKFVHTATVANISSNWTVIDNPMLNGNPDAIFFITQNWNPSGGSGVYNNSPTGVWYDGSNWAIFNQDIAPMPEGADFNVFIHSGSDDFVHTATVANISSNWTVIDNPVLNGNPDAIFFITQNWNPSGGSGVYNNSPTGVWYDGSNWAIFNQDIAPMPEGADFNIYLANDGVTGVEDRNDVVVERFRLEQNYPNPFNPSTTITYQVPENSFVSIKVYDVLGKEVTSLINEEKSVGSYEVEFDATSLPSGIYFYRLQAGNYTTTKKMILLK
jgi:hypothetical protein